MAHASSLEKAKTKMKNIKIAKGKRKAEKAKTKGEMGEQDYDKMVDSRGERTLHHKITTAIWDYEHKQYPMSKKDYLKIILKERLLEIMEPQNQLEVDEKKKIEVILNELV